MITSMRIEDLRPNDYNPNRMTDEEFAELVTEIRHLGRLPKPVVVRPDGGAHVIVDGEQSWRAAREAGLAEVACEVIEADDFEAMRQTYKRNQHGTHDPVLLGRMFRRMMETRGVSQRALAKETTVSEGTVRNALAYADAAALRNGYAFERLSVRQVRAYLALPASVRDTWLDAGAALDALVTTGKGGTYEVLSYEYGRQGTSIEDHYRALDEADLAHVLEATRWGFQDSARRAFRYLDWRSRRGRHVINVDAYLGPVAALRLPVELLDRIPAAPTDTGVQVLLSPEQWAQILRDCVGRATNAEERDAMIWASVRLTLRHAGIDPEDVANPIVVEALEELRGGPDFIREAEGLTLDERLQLAQATAEVQEDVLTEVKRRAVAQLTLRTRILTGQEEKLRGTSPEVLQGVQQQWAGLTAREAFEGALEAMQLEQHYARREALFSDRERLTDALIQAFKKWHSIRVGTVEGRPAWEVLKDRLDALPWPELVLLAALKLDEMAASALWLAAVDGKEPPSGSTGDPSPDPGQA